MSIKMTFNMTDGTSTTLYILSETQFNDDDPAIKWEIDGGYTILAWQTPTSEALSNVPVGSYVGYVESPTEKVFFSLTP